MARQKLQPGNKAGGKPKVAALVPWFGTFRLGAEKVGELLAGCEHVVIPFAGSLAEVVYLDARTIVASDIHRHLINLCATAKHRELGPKLYKRVRHVLFHGDNLKAAQQICIDWETKAQANPDALPMPDLTAAVAYFIATWMNRSAVAGTKGEFRGSLPTRWDAGGGDSVVRYRSAAKSLMAWRRLLQRVNFECLDVFAMLAKVLDRPGHGLYLDPPFPGAGDNYKFSFTTEQHVRLAKELLRFQHVRIVCRFHDHELVRKLYPKDVWEWHYFDGRKQTNEAAPEVLLVRAGTPRPKGK